jgi:hypothetical protein
MYTRQIHGCSGELNNFHPPHAPYCATTFHPLRESGVRKIILDDNYSDNKALPQIYHFSLHTDMHGECNGQLRSIQTTKKLGLRLHEASSYVDNTDNTGAIYPRGYIRQ